MTPFLSAGTFSVSSHIPRSGGLEYELQIKYYTDLDKKNRNKQKKLQYSVVYRFSFVSRGLLARAARAVHHLFDDLSTSSGLSTKTKRFGYFALVLSQHRLLFLST